MTKPLFVDTCFLLDKKEELFEGDKFYVSSITINELEGIKTSGTKSDEVKFDARKVLHLLEQNEDKYEIILYKNDYEKKITKFNLPVTNDSKIIISAYMLFKERKIDGVFATEDLACKAIAKSIGLETHYQLDVIEDYQGFIEVQMSDEELANFYNKEFVKPINQYDLLENEYLIIRNKKDVVDQYKWSSGGYKEVSFQPIESKFFGKTKPKDIYQQLAINSLLSNQLTVLRGPAGSGKSWLAMNYLISQLERGTIDKIVIFVNPVPVRGAGRIGFLPGTKEDKLLDSQIGNFLVSKFGSVTEVEKLITTGIIELIPLADVRGFDTTGMNCGIYVTEAQNSSVDLMKLMLQRIGDDSICVIEGDDKAQIDSSLYGGANNGLRRLSEVFKGHDFYGEVNLVTVHRSKIARIAELM